jgi:hypothetical protein
MNLAKLEKEIVQEIVFRINIARTMIGLIGIKKMKKIKLILMLPLLQSVGCQHLDKIQVKGEVTGTKYSSQQFTKGRHVISATYPISERINIKSKVAQPYISNHSVDNGRPDYGETGFEILF